MFKRHLRSVFSVPSFTKLYRVPEGDEGVDGGEGEGKGGTGGGGGNAGNEGDKGGEGKGGKDGGDSHEDRVARADHERALADMKKHKARADKLEQERKQEKESKLKEQNQWKEIAETKEREAAEAKQEADNLRASYVNDKKFNAVRSKCEALGLRPEAISDLEALDLEDIQIETTSTGKINVLGADKFASALKARKPHWFSDKAAPKVNTNGQRVIEGSGEVTVAELLKVEAEGKKSGNMQPYYELHKKYQQQRMAGSRR